MSFDTWQKPYNTKKRCTKSKFQNKPGVYIYRRKSDGKILYIGMSSSCIYKAFYRHFHKWNDCESRKKFNKTNSECRFIVTTKKMAHVVEVRLIRYFKPEMNGIFYENSFVDEPQEIEVDGKSIEICSSEIENAPF